MTNQTLTQNDRAKILSLEESLLLKSAIEDAKKTLLYTSKDSPNRLVLQAEIDVLNERWERESGARALRAALERKGFKRSDYDRAVWIRKNTKTGRWDKFSGEQALRLAGLLESK